jgi:hypothetical protein
MQTKFMQDIGLIYGELQKRQASLNSYYHLLKEDHREHKEAREVLDSFFSLLDIEENSDTQMAALTRIVNLREDALEQVLEKQGLSQEEIWVKKELAYNFVSTMHMVRHGELIHYIEDNKLLTPFYRALIFGFHHVGMALSEWQSYWTQHIVYGVNRELKMVHGDDAKVMAFLEEQELLDKDSEGNIAERCYSVLVKDESGHYQSVAYRDAFPGQTQKVLMALEELIGLVSDYEDDIFDQKEAWLAYFEALKIAFGHTHVDELVEKWAEVDRKWMAIKTPLQIGHPLEYYEDHYRKAVALEWDLRIVNPTLQEGLQTRENIETFAKEMAKKFGKDAVGVMENNLTQVAQTQLYIGQPVFYYAAEFNGLFSAQVVPNDENVSTALGKKIFAYADFVLASKKAKPVMRLGVESMGRAFLKKQRALMEENPTLWHQIYDISTIGHEYGHILWIDSMTESLMNKSGQFKNIEEFKATAGGLMAFFANEQEVLKEHIVDDVVSRAVGLMAWREVGEVLPYYCEGLIHLALLFHSGIMCYEDRVVIDYSKYETMKATYIEAYATLAQHYLAKKDAWEYLQCYATLEDGHYLPVDETIKSFVEHYYRRYKEIGQETIEL